MQTDGKWSSWLVFLRVCCRIIKQIFLSVIYLSASFISFNFFVHKMFRCDSIGPFRCDRIPFPYYVSLTYRVPCYFCREIVCFRFWFLKLFCMTVCFFVIFSSFQYHQIVEYKWIRQKHATKLALWYEVWEHLFLRLFSSAQFFVWYL